MNTLNVLITAASRRVPLVVAFQKALNRLGDGGRVIVTDVNPLSPAVHVSDTWYPVPMASDAGYLDAIQAICDAEQVGLIVPTIDDELELFAEHASGFVSRGIRVAVSSRSTCRICNDKYETSRHLRARGIAAAKTFLPSELPQEATYPLFIKPRFGRGGVGAFPIRTPRERDFFLEYVPDPVVQEYLHGPEFTIDLLCDFEHRLLSVVPRERVVVRAGVIDRGRTVKDSALIGLAESVANALPFIGAANVQCRVTGGRPVVFELNARFPGGIPLTIAAGADFPQMLVDLATGRSVAPSIGSFRDNLWMSNYESAVFLAPDGTVVVPRRDDRRDDRRAFPVQSRRSAAVGVVA